MSSHVDGGEDLGGEGRHHDPSTWRDKEMQGYRDQGCLDAGIQGCRGAGIRNVRIRSAGMRGYRDQGCKQLTHCLGRRKERNYGKHLASARGAPAPQGQFCGCRAWTDTVWSTEKMGSHHLRKFTSLGI